MRFRGLRQWAPLNRGHFTTAKTGVACQPCTRSQLNEFECRFLHEASPNKVLPCLLRHRPLLRAPRLLEVLFVDTSNNLGACHAGNLVRGCRTWEPWAQLCVTKGQRPQPSKDGRVFLDVVGNIVAALPLWGQRSPFCGWSLVALACKAHASASQCSQTGQGSWASTWGCPVPS